MGLLKSETALKQKAFFLLSGTRLRPIAHTKSIGMARNFAYWVKFDIFKLKAVLLLFITTFISIVSKTQKLYLFSLVISSTFSLKGANSPLATLLTKYTF